MKTDHQCFGQFCSICKTRDEKKFLFCILLGIVLALTVNFLSGCSTKKIEVRSVEIIPTQEKVQGYDVLALAKYCDTFLRAPSLPAFSTLLTTFGNPLPCMERRILQGATTDIQIDIRDATCFRNGVCPGGTPPLTDWKFLLEKVKAVNRYAVKYAHVRWWLSAWLEHDIKDLATVRKGCAVIKQGCPTCRCINSPFSGARPNEIPLELHGTKTRAFSVSGDGASSFDGDNILADGNTFQHRLAGSNSTYAWWNELNMRCTGEEGFTPIDERTVRPELWQFRMAHKIMSTTEDMIPVTPPQCRSVRKVVSPEIMKPTAERYCNGQENENDSRGNRPLLIIKKTGKPGYGLPVLRPDGTKVGCFRYYGPFSTPGLHRWYMGNCSGQNPWQLYRDLMQEWGYVLLGDGNCLLFNSIRRQGVYR